MDNSIEFDSPFSHVTYIEADQVILLTWKQFCCLKDYREPTTFALNLLREHEGSNFVVDARHGFEDVQEDVDWGFSFLLPEMARTSCQYVVFILNEVNEIEEEMDMWTKEFMKYFVVEKVTSYEEVLAIISVLKQA